MPTAILCWPLDSDFPVTIAAVNSYVCLIQFANAVHAQVKLSFNSIFSAILYSSGYSSFLFWVILRRLGC
jgi:hypothetical protein